MVGRAAACMRCAGGLFLLSVVLALAEKLDVKVPVVKWGQRPDRLYLTIPLTDVVEPEVTMHEKRIHLKAISKGQDYEVKLKLLRGINVSESKHDINAWSITFDLQKFRKEPCWKRLLRSKTTYSWLKKDHDKWYADECQRAKEEWRESYFTAKLKGEEPGPGKSGSEEDSPVGEDRKKEAQQWEKTLKDFRKRAVPRSSMASRKRAKRADQDEL